MRITKLVFTVWPKKFKNMTKQFVNFDFYWQNSEISSYENISSTKESVWS